MRITNKQKKELADVFKAKGLNISDFVVTGQHKEFKVKFKYEFFSFSINILDPDNYKLTIFPIDNTQGFSVGANWQNTKKRFTMWATQIANELNTATGWETFQSDNFLNIKYEEINQDFNETEKTDIRQSISELKERIKTLELSQEKLEIIDLKLDELSVKVDNLSKFDWKSLFIGSIASLIMTLVIPPEVSGIIWEYVKMAFSILKLKK